MLRPIIALATAAFVALAFAPTEASARPGGFRAGGFHSGFHGGFHHRGFGFRRFGPAVGVGLGLGLAGAYWGGPYYAYGDGCLAPRRIWTPYCCGLRWGDI